MRNWLIGLLFLVTASPALAGAPGIINQYKAVCDPDFPTRCVAPNADGSIDISGSISAETSAVATVAAPTYVEGTANPLSMDLNGGMRITGTINATSAATATAAAPSYVEGTSNPLSQNLTGDARTIAKQSGTWNIGTVTAVTTITNPVTVTDGAGALNVIVDSGTLTAVTSITNPVTITDGAGALNVIVDSGTLTAVTSITNPITVTDGAGSLNVIIDSGTLTAVTSITNAVTVAQATAANLNATVVGTGTFVTQSAITAASGSIASGAVASGAYASGAVASGAYASGSLASGAVVDITNVSMPITPATATATKTIGLGAEYRSTVPTWTNTQQGALQVGTRGSLHTELWNTDSATPVPSGSGTATGAIRVELPTNGTGVIASITNAVTVNTHAVTIASGGVASGAYASGAMASGAYASGSLASGAMVDITNVSMPITPATATATKTIGLGAEYRSTLPTWTNTQQGAMQVGTRGSLNVTLFGADSATAVPVSNGTNTGALRVTLASDSTGTVAITAASGSIASGAVASGAFASGSIASGALASGSIAAGAIAAGAIAIADNEDVASASADRGVKMLVIQRATPADTAADLDYSFPQMSAGRMWTSANVDQINGVTPLMGNGASGTGAQRVTIANDSTGILAAVTNVATIGTSVTPGTGAGNLGKAEDAALGSGDTGVMALAVQIATPADSAADNDYSPLQMKSGLLFTTSLGSTVGGNSVYVVEPAASDNHVVIKAGAGTVYGVHAFTKHTAAQYLRLYNATTGFNGCNSATNLQYETIIPAAATGAGYVVPLPEGGIAFATGISICVTGAYGNTDTTNATASVSAVNVVYK